MNKVKAYILSLTLLSANIVAIQELPVKRGRISNCYHKTCNKLSNHKGKVGFACGVGATYILDKVFSREVEVYIKPFFKCIFKRIGNFFKRVFNKNSSEDIK